MNTGANNVAAESRMETGLALETATRNSERIARMEGLLPQLATKEDIQKLRADLTWRMIIAMSILTAIFVGVVQLMVNGG